MKNRKQKSFFFRNGLSLAFLILFILSFAGQAITGRKELNELLKDHGRQEISFSEYFTSGHFIEATFENWESEFLQIGLFVVLTIILRQEGSSESKKLSSKEEVDRKPRSHPNAPSPVIKGGWRLQIYSQSLTIALFLLFIFSFILHWYGSWLHYNLEQNLEGKNSIPFIDHIFGNTFWFESLQNWQSEFLSVFALIFLSIYLRQKGSPQSKPVDAPHKETGE
ncbi:MAG: DUF6766 family protein [Ignavibacteria bacterium]